MISLLCLCELGHSRAGEHPSPRGSRCGELRCLHGIAGGKPMSFTSARGPLQTTSFGGAMSKLRFNISMSLDGFVAGPDPSEQEPLGRGGEELHEWVLPLAAWREPHGREGGEINASTPVVEGWSENVRAVI